MAKLPQAKADEKTTSKIEAPPIPAEDYDQHVRDREPRDIGRWVADAVLASVNLAIARKEPTDG